MCSYIIIMIKIWNPLKNPEFCFSCEMIHFQLQMFLKWKNDRQWNLNFPGLMIAHMHAWRARENSKWYKFKKPRFGTFQSIMIIFYVKLLENIYLWRKKPHRPSKTHFLPKFHLIEEEEKSKFCEIVDDNRMNVDCLTKRHPWKKFSLMFR